MPIELSRNCLQFLPFGDFSPEKFEEISESLTFMQINFNPADGTFENIHLLYKMMPVLEEYSDIFDDDTISLVNNYNAWLDVVLGFIRDVSPWFYIILKDGVPSGAVWAANWESFGGGFHAVEVGGLVRRKINPVYSLVTFYKFLSLIFAETDVNIIRAEFSDNNRAVQRCLSRLGFSHPETRRCLKIRNGAEITGRILSMTRKEWEALHVSQEEK